jgi:hypothetical protein
MVIGLRARPLLPPKLFQTIRHGTPRVVPLRTAKVSFCDGIPGSAIFFVAQKVRHLATFDGVPA